MKYMLDTNTVSYFLTGHGSVRSALLSKPTTSICVSVITEAELYYGLARRPDAMRLQLGVAEFLRRVDVVPWTSAIAVKYGTLRVTLEQAGKTLAPLDLQIAAHALAVDAVLVTSDKAFANVPDLKIESWV